MERHTEFPLFFQSAFAMVAFLIVVSLFSLVFETKSLPKDAAVSSVEVSVVR